MGFYPESNNIHGMKRGIGLMATEDDVGLHYYIFDTVWLLTS